MISLHLPKKSNLWFWGHMLLMILLELNDLSFPLMFFFVSISTLFSSMFPFNSISPCTIMYSILLLYFLYSESWLLNNFKSICGGINSGDEILDSSGNLSNSSLTNLANVIGNWTMRITKKLVKSNILLDQF